MADSAEALTAPPATAAPRTRNPLRRLYHWILSWAHHPAGTWALAFFSFVDSSVFPIPPLFLQVALSLEKPRRSFAYALVNSAASVAGAVLGYLIGYALWDTLGLWVLGRPLPEDLRADLQAHHFRLTLVYSFVPLPYKLITIGSGFLRLNLVTLLAASAIGRSARFFLLGVLTFILGRRAKDFIGRYFNGVCLAVGLLVAAALVVLKGALQR